MRSVRESWLSQAKRLYVGETARIRHPADTRADRPSVLISNQADRWAARCFRRNTGDVVFKDHVIPYKAPKDSESVRIPDDIVPVSTLPAHEQRAIIGFVVSKGLSASMLPELLYSPSRQRLIIATDCQYLLGRDLTESSPVKWMDYTRRGKKHLGYVRKGGKVVLVEDVLSYYKVRYALGDEWDVLCLLGTVLRPSAALELVRASKVVVILDGDKAGRAGASKIRRNLTWVPEVVVVNLQEGLDPKDLHINEIRETIRG